MPPIDQTKILIIEDEEIVVKNLRLALEKEKYKVFVSLTGEETLNLINQLNPDLIILDIILPQMSGTQLLRILKGDARTKKIPVIILSQLDSDKEIQRGLDLGAIDYLPKSLYDIKDIIIRINKFIRTGV